MKRRSFGSMRLRKDFTEKANLYRRPFNHLHQHPPFTIMPHTLDSQMLHDMKEILEFWEGKSESVGVSVMAVCGVVFACHCGVDAVCPV